MAGSSTDTVGVQLLFYLEQLIVCNSRTSKQTDTCLIWEALMAAHGSSGWSRSRLVDRIPSHSHTRASRWMWPQMDQIPMYKRSGVYLLASHGSESCAPVFVSHEELDLGGWARQHGCGFVHQTSERRKQQTCRQDLWLTAGWGLNFKHTQSSKHYDDAHSLHQAFEKGRTEVSRIMSCCFDNVDIKTDYVKQKNKTFQSNKTFVQNVDMTS